MSTRADVSGQTSFTTCRESDPYRQESRAVTSLERRVHRVRNPSPTPLNSFSRRTFSIQSSAGSFDSQGVAPDAGRPIDKYRDLRCLRSRRELDPM